MSIEIPYKKEKNFCSPSETAVTLLVVRTNGIGSL